MFHMLFFFIFQNDTKPVKMMYQKSKFPLTFIHEVNCQVICSKSVSMAGNPSPVNLAAFKIV